MKKNILIYDGDDEILLLCKAILGSFGFAVETLGQFGNAAIKDISKKVNEDGYVENPFTVSNFIETIIKYAGERTLGTDRRE